MKIGKLRKDTRFDTRTDKSLGIQTYGENNSYPQNIVEVVNASATGKPCVEVYSKFISGRGFADKKFYKKVVNHKGHTLDYILDEISKDYALFGGFSLHVNYNANYKVVSIQHIPFETVRFESMNDDGEFHRVALHPDWCKQLQKLRKWRKEDIDFINLFNPDPEQIKLQVEACGGWYNYKGQIYYYSNQGEKVYPIPIFDNVITDMNTQEGISNVLNRNARNNFFPAGLLIDIINSDESEAQRKETEDSILDMQGDESACNLGYSAVNSREEIPEFIPFKGENYDKQFDSTRKAAKEDIGAAFNQPPILRAENVGANFGADLMKNAYNYYNSVTENERLSIERVFDRIFKYWYEQINGLEPVNHAIEPLSYEVKMTLIEKLGEKGFEQLIGIIENVSLTNERKRRMITRLFELSDEEINDLLEDDV